MNLPNVHALVNFHDPYTFSLGPWTLLFVLTHTFAHFVRNFEKRTFLEF